MTGAPAEPARVGRGLAGCGAFGSYVLDAIRDLPGVRVVTVADPDAERREALTAVHGALAREAFEALLARPDVDAMAITTPPAIHALRCARKGGEPVAGAYAGLTAVVVAEAATLAMQSGATVPVPAAGAATAIGAGMGVGVAPPGHG